MNRIVWSGIDTQIKLIWRKSLSKIHIQTRSSLLLLKQELESRARKMFYIQWYDGTF